MGLHDCKLKMLWESSLYKKLTLGMHNELFTVNTQISWYWPLKIRHFFLNLFFGSMRYFSFVYRVIQNLLTNSTQHHPSNYYINWNRNWKLVSAPSSKEMIFRNPQNFKGTNLKGTKPSGATGAVRDFWITLYKPAVLQSWPLFVIKNSHIIAEKSGKFANVLTQ